MTRLLPYELIIENMKGSLRKSMRGYSPKEEAYESLKKMTGMDFGYDIQAWEKWLKANNKK